VGRGLAVATAAPALNTAAAVATTLVVGTTAAVLVPAAAACVTITVGAAVTVDAVAPPPIPMGRVKPDEGTVVHHSKQAMVSKEPIISTEVRAAIPALGFGMISERMVEIMLMPLSGRTSSSTHDLSIAVHVAAR
jgi:hypothetical protein